MKFTYGDNTRSVNEVVDVQALLYVGYGKQCKSWKLLFVLIHATNMVKNNSLLVFKAFAEKEKGQWWLL